MAETIPAVVLELAKKAAIERVPNPVPIKWAEYPGSWMIIFEDGRKMNFIKEEATPEASKPKKGK